MPESGLRTRVNKAFTPTTTKADPTKQAAPNVLARDLGVKPRNQKWVNDRTYIWTANGGV